VGTEIFFGKTEIRLDSRQITQPNCSTRGAEIPDSTRQCQFDSDGEGVFGRHLIVIEWSNVYFGGNDRCAQFLPPRPKSSSAARMSAAKSASYAVKSVPDVATLILTR
jgi:hypothetical protein